MKLLCILLLFISITQSSIHETSHKTHKDDNQKLNNDDRFQAKMKARILARARMKKDRSDGGPQLTSKRQSNPHVREDFYMDPVLNQLTRRRASDSDESEVDNWKAQFNEIWMQKKFEAINTTMKKADTVNMAAARPWGIPCGDPNQFDMPAGNCMLAAECESEYRIYRGDSFCGRTQFICCALQINTYDLYQGFDVSFDSSSFATDSNEKHKNKKPDTAPKKKKRDKAQKKRQNERKKRKKKIKKQIKEIVREIRHILDRTYKNSSKQREKRAKIIKKYIKQLKTQFKKDRKVVVKIHTGDINRIDQDLMAKLHEIRDLNKNFLMNSTFREIIINGTLSKAGARMLAEAYPELTAFIPNKFLRRNGGGKAHKGSEGEVNDYFEYDIEYGALYY